MSFYQNLQTWPHIFDESHPVTSQSHLRTMRETASKKTESTKKVLYQEKTETLRQATEEDGYDYQRMVAEMDKNPKKKIRENYREKIRKLNESKQALMGKYQWLIETDAIHNLCPMLSTFTDSPVFFTSNTVQSEQRTNTSMKMPEKRKREDDDEEIRRKKQKESPVPSTSTTSHVKLMNSVVEEDILELLNFSSTNPEASCVDGPGGQTFTAGPSHITSSDVPVDERLDYGSVNCPAVSLSDAQLKELQDIWTVHCTAISSDAQRNVLQGFGPVDCPDTSSDAQLNKLLGFGPVGCPDNSSDALLNELLNFWPVDCPDISSDAQLNKLLDSGPISHPNSPLSDDQLNGLPDSGPVDCYDSSLLDAHLIELLYQASKLLC